MADSHRLTAEQLRWESDLSEFDFTTTDDLPELEGTIGQERALKAIDFGLSVTDGGFNLYLSGETGTGRSSTIKNLLKKLARTQPTPLDWCYVHNFKEPDNPASLSLPAGLGSQLAQDMKEIVDGMKINIPRALDSKEYESNRAHIVEAYQEKNSQLFTLLEQEAERQGFALQRTVSGLVIVPQKEGGQNYTNEEFDALPESERNRMEAIGKDLTEKLNDVLRQVRDNEKAVKEELAQLDRDLGLSAVGHHIDPLKEKYAGYEKIVQYLDAVQEDILINLEDFKPQQPQQQILPGLKIPRQEPSFERYIVNVIVDNKDTRGAPVVFEANPTYNNLFGRIEHVMQMGGMATTSFTLIKAGALHRANGGYLIIDAREVLINPFAWDALKRCIRNSEIKIEDVLEQYRFMTFISLKPQPVPLHAKIVMIGTPYIYYLLYYLEPDYRKFFKVKADFDSRLHRTPDIVRDFALFVATHCKSENLVPFDRSGVAGLLEYASRLVEDQEKLSSQFMDIADLIHEASYWAGKEGSAIVTREIVKRAVDEKTYRSNRIEERVRELIAEGTILVDTAGSEIGQINGLSVLTIADFMFGRPSRVTARIYLGKTGMVNIEREVKLSGPIHDKGVMILTGYLGGRYAWDKPLSFSASICFEQSYEGVEGDSASSTELYALLSALSGVPLRQGIAVTGSVNQLGKVQPIGGVNYKIEGFYQVCKVKGLTGDQGVIIPKSNERHLMLNDEVTTAVRDGKFSVWSVATIDEGIELLTGVPAGELQGDGTYPEGSINYLVNRRLLDLVEKARRYSGRSEKEEK